jgi:hypothetical protein
VTLSSVYVSYPAHAARGGSCTTAQHLTFFGNVRLRADIISGRAFGVLPLTLSTATVPPVPVPYLHLADVKSSGLWSRADHAALSHAAITPGACSTHSTPRARHNSASSRAVPKSAD